MGYSVTHNRGAGSSDTDDTNLVGFALKRARSHFANLNGLVKVVGTVTTPIVFLGSLISGPIWYRTDNKYIAGTPECDERLSKIRVFPLSPFGVDVIYPDWFKMILKKAEYSVKPGKVDEVKQAIMQFVFHIKEDEPAVMFYEAFHVSGSNDFIHFMSFMDESAEKAHQNAGHTKAFVDKLHPLCTKKPVFKDLDLIAANKARLQ